MNTLLDTYSRNTMNKFSTNPYSKQGLVNGSKLNHTFMGSPVLSSSSNSISTPPDPSSFSSNPSSPEGEYSEDNAVLKFIKEMLMDEDLEGKTCMFQDCMALQAAEKDFYEALNGKNGQSSLPIEYLPCLDRNISEDFSEMSSVDSIFGHSGSYGDIQIQNSRVGENDFSNIISHDFSYPVPFPIGSSINYLEHTSETGKDHTSFYHNSSSVGRKSHNRQEDDYAEEGRSSKHSATYTELSEQLEIEFDKVLLCGENDSCNDYASPQNLCIRTKGSSNHNTRGRRKDKKHEVVDLTGLLTQCAQSVASYDYRNANELLKQIRQHSSPYGDGTQRLAHYFANGLEARLAGTTTEIFSVKAARTPAAEILKSYCVYVTACPFKKMSNFFANRTIRELTEKKNATRLHIIDFGIFYGFQWPCLIHRLSKMPNGPPKLHITGIDFPQPGFRPAERVEETGRRLKRYCDRFGVPFEYTAIAQKWETIKLEDLKIEKDEVLVVNCLYRLKDLFDESVVMSSPRDMVLDLIRRINPELFIHGVVNGTYNAPFFLTRFKEALFHYSALFDMYEATIPREESERMMYEKEVFGRDAINTIACEGLDRVDRPETYKQWQVRNKRAGFKQVSLDKELLNTVKSKVKFGYNKDFLVDDNGKWLFQGWKGRIIYALSCWKAAN